MKLIGCVICILICLGCNSVWAIQIVIDGTTIHLPTANGFSEITQNLPEVKTTAESMTPPQNRLLAVFLSDSDVAMAVGGQVVGFHRYALVQTSREFEKETLSKNQFSDLKQAMKQNLGISLETLDETNRLLVGASDELSKRLQIDLLNRIEKPIVLSTDTDTATGVGGTILFKVTNLVDGVGQDFVVVGNITTLLVKGKIVFFYLYSTYSDKNDIDFTRWTAIDWIRQIELANYSADDGLSQESIEFISRILRAGGQGLVTGLGIALLAALFTAPAAVMRLARERKRSRQWFRQSEQFYEEAVKHGNAQMLFERASQSFRSDGTELDRQQAVRLSRMAAETGHTSAQLNLGAAYESGIGTTQDYAEALIWYACASILGNDSACNSRDRVEAELSSLERRRSKRIAKQLSRNILRRQSGARG